MNAVRLSGVARCLPWAGALLALAIVVALVLLAAARPGRAVPVPPPDAWRWAAGVAAVAVVLAVVLVQGLRARERRQARAQEQELRVLIAGVQELIFRTDAEGRLTYVSPRWADLGLAAATDALGRSLADGVAAGSRAAARRLFAPVDDQLPDNGLRRAQLRMGAAGQERHYDVQVRALTQRGRVVGFAGSAVDITERLATQAQLREQLAFNERLLEVLPLPVAMLDVDGNYAMVNQAWEQLNRRSRQQVLGQPARRFMAGDEAAFHDRADQAGGATAPASLPMRVTTRGGTQCDLLVSRTPVLCDDGRRMGVLVAYQDETEQREAQRVVSEARDAAEEASRAKSEFVANISHELRTPLQSIIGFSELGEHRGRAASPRLAGMFHDIHQSGQRMLALVNDLLDVSRIESTVGTFHLERTDLRPLVREVARELEPLLARRSLRIELALGELPLVAKVDPMRIQQVVRNVLANAIRFSPDGAAIDLQGEHGAPNELHLSVRDRGPGIPPDEVESIFEAFVQSSRTKDGAGGTGLGLAICRKILVAQGGRIVAANAAGGGSVFTITLPVRGFADTQPLPLG